MGMESNSTLIHEIGHRFYYRSMPTNAQAYWEEVIDSRSVKITAGDVQYFVNTFIRPEFDRNEHMPYAPDVRGRVKAEIEEETPLRAKMHYLALHFPGGQSPDEAASRLMGEVDTRVDLEFISEYGATNAKEAFAEAFMLWVTKGPRAVQAWTRDFFVRLTRAGGGSAKYARGF
jgi:hypothetical protein